MSIGNAIFQGIIQGLTEFLPISSSGHLALVQYFTGQGGQYGLFFTVLLHLGTLLAVIIAFWRTIADLTIEFFRMLGDIFRGKFSLRSANPKRRMILLLMVSLLPLFITFLLRDWFASLATGDSLFPIGISFLLTSLLLFLADRCAKGHKTAKDMRVLDAVAIGAVQAFALPGLSRSGSTISVGLMVGLERKYVVAFSFIMSLPAVVAANILELGDAMRQGVTIPVPAMVIGTLFSLVFGLLAIRMVRWLVVSDKFKYFAWYTLVLGILVITAATIEHFTGGLIQSIVMG